MSKIEKQIMRHEDFRSMAYSDLKGNLTIGYGRNLESKGLSKIEALMLLRNDIAECEADLCKIFGKPLYDLDNNRRWALIDMRYNLGPGGFRGFVRMINAVKCGFYAQAAKEMRHSAWYEQVGDRGKTLHDMMLKGDDL